MRKTFLALIAAAVVTGCSTTPGTVSSSTSKYDGTQTITAEPGIVYSGMLSSNIRLGGYWNAPMGEEMIIVATYDAVKPITGLKFNIDGKKVELSPADRFTDYDFQSYGQYGGRTYSSQRFLVPLSLIRELIAAKKVIVRLDFDKTFSEGELKGGMNMAKTTFERLLAKVDKAR